MDEVNQSEVEELGHDGGVRVGVPRAALGGLFVGGFLILGPCIEPLLVELRVAIEVSKEEDGFAGIEERFGLRAQKAGLLHSEGVLRRGEVHDEEVHSLDLAVQIAVPHSVEAFLDDGDLRVRCQPHREALFLEDDGVVVVPLPGDFLEGSLLESVDFLQRDNVGLLLRDPLRTDIRGLAMVEAAEDVVGEDAERLGLCGIDTE